MGIGGLVLWFVIELRNPDLGMANRKEAERFAAVSTGICHLLVCRTSPVSHDFQWNAGLPGFVLNAYLWLLLESCFACPRSPFPSSSRQVNPYPNNRRLWMR